MTDKDFAVATIAGIPQVGGVNRKPTYLVLLEDTSGKKNSYQKFIALDKPDSQNGFIMTKGFFCDLSEDEIFKTFADILTRTPKEAILDVWFPWHRVCSVRSLVFNANKLQTLVK
jgi:hypothetical protein